VTFADIDAAVRPQDDLYRHINGGWLATAVIDDDKPNAGSFVELREASEHAVRDIITGLADPEPGSEADKIATLFASFMDVAAVEALGAKPLAPLLARVDQIVSVKDLVRHLGWAFRRGIANLVGMDVDADPGDPTRYLMFVGQSGLGLPDESYYREPQHAELLGQYREHVAGMLLRAGVPNYAAQAQAVVDLETKIAACHWDRVRTRDMVAMYTLQTLDELAEASPNFFWREFLRSAGIPEEAMAELVNAQHTFPVEVSALLTSQPLESWKSWARWKIVTSLAPYLSSELVDEKFRFYGTVLSGTPVLKDRWKRGVDLVEGALGEAVGKLYVERHFSPVAKERMDDLVAHLLEAYRVSITHLAWMTPDTKVEALAKLDKFRPKIGFPAKWRDYSGLSVSKADLVGNVLAVNSFELDYTLSKLAGPVDPDEWFMTPQTVNAYYHPLRNEIVFPAAILQPPFFDEHADDAVNYGGIGSVIGHEIGHGFDDQGSTCDGDGRLRNWWTEDDQAAFRERTRALIDQYASLSPEGADGQKVNGELTIGENIGDLGGLGIAYQAWQLAGGDPDGEPVDGLTPAQRFFAGYAAIWRYTSRPELVKQRLVVDPHSPAEFRCNQIVRNVDAFFAAFGVTPDDDLWLDEAQRVTIW